MKDIVFLIPLVLCACGNDKNQIAVSHNNMTSFDSDTLWIDEPDILQPVIMTLYCVSGLDQVLMK